MAPQRSSLPSHCRRSDPASEEGVSWGLRLLKVKEMAVVLHFYVCVCVNSLFRRREVVADFLSKREICG
ncbi:hypothetical protein A4A49_56417 [Nicotiana attenuata]|uniref:Uncharacterized protein n=1 Tax=Nicotiana attenuata TaxID=49451 RepID=A0A314KYN5_NICAT|nr:hypothetical protein A4A49_56417 [Nicotiana attenuata]